MAKTGKDKREFDKNMRSEAPVFEKIYNDYLAEVAALDLTGKSELLGIRVDGNAIGIPFFNQCYTITKEKITDRKGNRPQHSISVILCKYLLLCPEIPGKEKELVTYKDFRDGAPYVLGFRNTAEKPISMAYSGNIDALETHCQALGGKPCDLGISCDLSYVFQALPEVPIYLVYNDEDEDFPADCSLLFEKRAAHYLDMECLAMIGMLLAQRLAP
jgi:hypothetical protein